MPDNTTTPPAGQGSWKSPRGMRMPMMGGFMPYGGMMPGANKKAPQKMEEPKPTPLAAPMTGPNAAYNPLDQAGRANLLASMIRRGRGGGGTGGTGG